MSSPERISHEVDPGGDDASRRGLVGADPMFRAEIEKARRFATCDANVLVLGETGTGKELFAQAVHYWSSRASGPWIAVNCGAIPNELFEAELFGHLRGAFTSATTARAGLVREAHLGTLFLDEVDTLPPSAQVKLLRFLQEGEFRQVGSNEVQHADVRVIAASNCELPERVKAGVFRQDLFYRLHVLSLYLPALRDRREDIATLAHHFLRQFARRAATVATSIEPDGIAALMAHDWPGNVRELQHIIERAALLARRPAIARDELEIDAKPHAGSSSKSLQDAKRDLIATFEKSFIEGLLRANGGNITHAARAARKNRRAFFQLMRKYRIEPSRFRPLD